MLDQVLEGQQKMGVDFNKKLDSVHTELNRKFEIVYTHVKKLDVQVAQTIEPVKIQEIILRRRL